MEPTPHAGGLRFAGGSEGPLYSQEGDGEQVQLPLVISSMQGKHQRLLLRKRDGYEDADVLDELDSAGKQRGIDIKLPRISLPLTGTAVV